MPSKNAKKPPNRNFPWMSSRSPPCRVCTAGATTGFLGAGDPRLAGFLPVRALAANRNKRHSTTPGLKPDRIRQFPEQPSIQRDHDPSKRRGAMDRRNLSLGRITGVRANVHRFDGTMVNGTTLRLGPRQEPGSCCNRNIISNRQT